MPNAPSSQGLESGSTISTPQSQPFQDNIIPQFAGADPTIGATQLEDVNITAPALNKTYPLLNPNAGYDAVLTKEQQAEALQPKQPTEAEIAFSNRLKQIKNVYDTANPNVRKSTKAEETISKAVPDSERAGNRATYLYNKILDGVGSVASGIGDMAVQGASIMNTGVLDASPVNTKLYREQIAPDIRTYLKDTIGAKTDKGLEARYNNETVTSAIGGVFNSAPAMLMTAASGGLGTGAMFAQSFDNAIESINQSEEGRNLDEATKSFFAGGVGIATALLEKYSFDKIFKGETGIIGNAIAKRALRNASEETGGKVTGDVFSKFLDKEIVNLTNKYVKGGARLLDASLVEYATEASQEAAQAGAELLVNKQTGKPVFDTSETSKWDGFLNRINKAGVVGAIGGVFMGGLSMGISNLAGIKPSVVEESQSKLDDINTALNNENISEAAKEVLVQEKIKIQDEAQKIADKVDEAYDKLDDKQKERVVEIIDEKAKLQEALADENVPESVKKTLTKQSEELDNELSQIKPVEEAKGNNTNETTNTQNEAVTEPKIESNEETNQVTEQQVPKTEETVAKTGEEVLNKRFTLKDLEDVSDGSGLVRKGETFTNPDKLHSQLKKGDKVKFFSEKERNGIYNGKSIIDDKGNQWGMLAILSDKTGWIEINNKSQQQLAPKKAAQESVKNIYESDSKIKEVGTEEEFNDYSKAIFPDSKVKDVVYHGTNNDFKTFEKGFSDAKNGKTDTQGIHFVEEAAKDEYGKNYGKMVPAKLDFKNPLEIEATRENADMVERLEYLSQKDMEDFKKQGYDSAIIKRKGETEYIAFEPEQIVNLSYSERFKTWKESKSLSVKPILNETNKTKKKYPKEPLKNVQSTFEALSYLNDIDESKLDGLTDFIDSDYSVSEIIKPVKDRAKQVYTPATLEEIKDLQKITNPKEILQKINKETKEESLRKVSMLFLENYSKIAPFIQFKIDLARDLNGNAVSGNGSYAGGKIDISVGAFRGRKNLYFTSGIEQGFKTILHEFTHAFTIDAYRSPSNKIERDFKDYIDKTYKELKKNSMFSDSYGFSKPEEFIAEIFTNPEFRYSAPIYESGFLDKVIEFIAKMFGYIKDKNSASDARFDKAKEAFDVIFRTIPNIRAGKGKDIFYETTKNINRISEAYHKAKKDGNNPKLVEAVEKIIKENDSSVQETQNEKESNTTGITQEATAKARESMGVEAYEKQSQSNEQRRTRAEKAIKDGYNVKELIGKIKASEDFVPSRQEFEILKIYENSLAASIAKNPTSERIAERADLLRNVDIATSRVGSSLQAIAGLEATEDNLANFLQAEAVHYGVDELPQNIIDDLKSKYEKGQEAKQAYEAGYKKAKDELIKQQAELELAKQRKKNKSSVKKSSADYASERAELKQSIKDKLKKARGQLNAVPVPYLNELIAIAPDVAKLVKSYVEEGVSKLDDIVKRVHKDLEDEIDGITEQDVIDLISGQYNAKRPTKTDILVQVRDLKEQAKLLKKIEDLENGKVPTDPVKQVRRNAELEALRKQIKELEDEVGITEQRTLKTRRTALTNKIKQLQEDLEAGNFDLEPAEPRRVRLDAETQKKQDEYIEFLKETNRRRDQAIYEQQSKITKAWLKFQQVLGLRRLIQTSIDFSMPFRQAVTVTLNPRYVPTTLRSFANMFKSTFSEKQYDRIMFNIQQDPLFLDMKADGLKFSEIDSKDNLKREEDYRTSFLYQIPYLREPFLASNRAAAGYINTARYNLYLKGVERLRNQGITHENSPENYAALAKWTMNMTGRGNLLDFMEKGENASKWQRIMGDTFYGTRLMASRFNMLNPNYYIKMPKEQRIEALKDIGSYVALSAAVALGAVAAGATVSTDPEDADFLKAKWGDKRYDIYSGGMNTYLRTAYRLMKAMYQRTNPKLYGKNKDKAALKKANKYGSFAVKSTTDFFRYKLAPNTSYVLSATLGKDPLGRDFNPNDILAFYPMYVDDLRDAMKKDDAALEGLSILAPSLFGIGVQEYSNKKKPTKEKE